MLSPEKCMTEDRRITLEHLRAFVAVADKGSFQRAGQILGRTQSAVTQGIKKLEDYLHCTLFERRHGLVIGLTDQGTRLLPLAREILSRLDSAVRVLQRQELKGRIRIGVPPSFRAEELQTAISCIMAMNSGLRVQVLSDMSAHMDAMLSRGVLDVAVLSRNTPEETPAGGVLQRVIKSAPLEWVSHKPMVFKDDTEVPLVTYTEGSPWRESAIAALESNEKRYYFSYLTASYESVCGAIGSGFGVTALPRWDIGEEFAVLGEAHGLPTLPDVHIILKTPSQSRTVKQFCEMILDLPSFADAQSDSLS